MNVVLIKVEANFVLSPFSVSLARSLSLSSPVSLSPLSLFPLAACLTLV
jgi:hypothetical protein